MEASVFKKSRLSQLVAHGLIISGRGGSKGGGSARTPVEANDTVNSRAMASVLDLLGEGVVGGLVDGAKSIFLNDTPLQNADGSYNFSGVTWWFRDGSQDQTVIDGFDFIETPKSVGMQLKQTSQVNVSLDSADSDRVRVVMKFPSLRKIDKKNGDTNGTTVQYKFQIDSGNGKGFVDAIAEGEDASTITLTAKKTGVYYRSYVFDLPKPAKSYTLRAIRLTEDHKDDSYLYDDTYIDSIGEIVNTSLNYPNSVLAGLKINSEQFGSSMPTRSYLIKGMKIRVPSNYNADTNTYDGNWDGTFKLASTSNPAWILFDLLTNTRYGLGEFVKESMINIGELYQIGRYCDAFVDDGFGSQEKRFAINTQITSRQDAYRVVQDIAGAFRGMVYWAGGMVHVTQDSPADPVMLFSNSNVVNGSFVYKGSARKDRYSVALITYNNKEDGYKQSVEYVEDQEAIKRYGIRKTESVAFGCTSRGQAHRVGLWTLYTSRMESDVITYSVGMDSVFLMPGDVVLIADKFRAGRRNSGRITGYTANSVKLDSPVDLTSVGNHITFLSSEGKMVERDILENGKNVSTVTFKTALTSAETPVADAVWVIAQPDLVPLQARVVSVAEGTDGTSFNITAIQNNPTKYEAIDNGAQLIPQNTTVLDPTFSKPSGLTVTEGTYLSSPGNLSVSLTAAWQGKSAQYYVSWRRSDAGNVSNWQSQRVTEEQFELRGVAEDGQYDFQVYAVSVGGRKTDPISITYKVLGTLSAPEAPTGLTAAGDYRSIVLNWANPSSVDLDHIEVLASKINDKAKAQVIAKVSGTTFSHNGLEDSATWYYWVRAANKRGMLSAVNSPLATTATTRDVLSFLKNKITESELGQDLIADIDSKAVAVEVDAAIDEAKSQATSQVNDARTESENAVSDAKKTLNSAINKEITDRANAVADEASNRAQAVSNEATARAAAISAETDARNKAISAEASARAKAMSDEAIARASAISDSVAVESNNRAKAISDSATSLNAKIEKEIRDRATAVSTLDTKTANAITAETSSRIADMESEARARADGLLQEKNNRQSEISNLSTQMQTANESMAQQISQIAAGTGEQFDSLNIWYFDTNNEGWTEDDNGSVPMNVTSDGWLKAANSTSSCRSPNNMTVDANAYRFIKLRIKKVGKPVWAGKLYWIGASEQGWTDARSISFDEPEYDANGIATLSLHDIDWRSSTTIRRLRLDFLKGQNETNYLLIDWIAVGRPTPGAGMAALQEEKAARVDADAAEAASRNTLAVQMRGSYEGSDLAKVGSGLIFQEQQARVTADKAEAAARQSLETKVNDSVSNINKSLDTLNTQDSAMASDITGLKSSLKDKADASALQTLKTSVDQQGSNISTQGQSITKLQNDLSTTNANVGKKADQTALTALQGTVTQQGKDISAANSSITNLKTSLDTTNNNVAKKADATAVNDLTSRVSATEGKVSSQADSIVQLNNSLSNAIADSDASAKTPNNLIVNPSFERGFDGYIGVSSKSTVVEIQSPHTGTRALKIDPGSIAPGQNIDFVKDRTYEIGVWVKQISGTTDNGSGNNKLRVGSSAGNPVFELPFTGVSGEWTKFSRRWKATETASLPVTLNNYLTAGNRYFDDFYVIDVTDSVNIDANASALSSIQNTVTQQGKDIASQSTSITDLKNNLDTTNANVAKKADAEALQTLQNTVSQQGKDIASASSSITSLQNNLSTTNANVAKKADATALSSLQNTVTQQGKDLTSVGSRATNLENSLKTTDANVAKKADAAALSSLQNTVTQQGKDISSAGDSITSLNNNVNAMLNMGDNLVQDADLIGDGSAFGTQQNSVPTGSLVEFGAYGENSSGVRMIRVNSTSPGLFANRKKPVPVNGSRKFRYIVRAKGVSGSMNMLLRRWNFNGSAEGNYEDKNVTLASDWQTVTWDTSFSPNAGVDGQAFGIYCHPSNAEIWVDSFQVFDITDAVNNDATASALSDLSTKVTKQGDTISSQGTSITKLQNDLTSTKTDVSKKADASALQTLQNTVVEQGKTLTSQGSSITKLQNDLSMTNDTLGKKADAAALSSLTNRVDAAEMSLTSQSASITQLNNSVTVAQLDADAGKNQPTNQLVNGSFERGFDGWRNDSWTTLAAQSPKSGKLILQAGKTANNGTACDQDVTLKAGRSYRFGAWVRKSADFAISNPSNTKLSLRNSTGPVVDVMMPAADISGGWTLFTGEHKASVDSTMVFSLRTSLSAGYLYLDDAFLIDITDEKAIAANASATSALTSRVESAEGKITSQGQQITQLNNSISGKADASALQTLQNTVTQQGKTLTSQGDSITSLNNSLKGKADAGAVNSLTSRVTEAEGKLSSQGSAITKLQNDLTTTNANVNKKADSSALQSLQNTVAEQGNTLTSQGQSITQLTNDLSTANGNIAKKADGTAVTALTNRVTDAEGTITAQGDQLTTLKNSLAEGSLISNGGLGVDASFWDSSGSGSAFTYDAGEKALRTTTGSIRVANTTRIPVEAGTILTLSFEMKSSEAITNVSADTVGFITDLSSPTTWLVSMSPWLGGVATSWQTKSVELTIPDNFTGNFVYLRFAAGGWTPSTSARLYLRNVDVFSSNGVAKKANASAVNDLTSRVDSAEGMLASQSQSITKLQNDLVSTNNNVSKKADQSALTSLTGRVEKTENGMTAANSNITSLTAAITAAKAAGDDLIPNPTFDPTYNQMGYNVVSTGAEGVPAGCPFKYATRLASRDHIPNMNNIVATAGDVIEFSALVACGTGTAAFNLYVGSSGSPTGGIAAANSGGSVSAAAGATWVRTTWRWTVTETVAAKGFFRPFLQISQSAPFSTIWYVTDWHCRNITAAAAAQSTADVTSKAVDSLTSTVTQQGKDVSSVSARATALENGLSSANTNIGKKADASALQTLQNAVTQQGNDITASNANVTSLQASLTRRTVFTITSRGNGSSAKDGIFDDSGVKVFAPGRSYALVTFKANSDGSTSIDTSKTYDVFGSANNGKTMSDDITALANGVYACVMTYDEPTGSRSSVYAAIELLGGTSEVLASLPYRGAYILLGRKGMKAGDGLELRSPTGSDQSAFVSTSVEFVNGVMMGLGAAGGVMMKADANASAITTLQNTVTQQGKDITSSSSAITSLQNGLATANTNIGKKADATALQSLQNTVTQQGKDISTQSGNVTNLQNSLSATNTGLANLVADSDASKKIIGNLLTNPSFERGLEGFGGGASFMTVINAQSPNSGSKILSCGAGTGAVSQSIVVTKDRTYKIGVFARCQSGSVIDNQGNNKLRIGNSSLLVDVQFKPADLPTGSTWKEVSGTWKATVSGSVDVSINSSLKSGNQYFDDFYFIDITDIVNIDATSNAVASLTSRVTSAEGTVSSHTGSITNLSNSLNSLNNTVSGKADASALQSLQNTVTQQGKDLSSASGSVTDLKSSLNTLKVQSNPWIDGTFETYDNNQQLGGNTAIVSADFKSTGSKCLKVIRPANTSGNADKTIGSYSVVRQSAKYRIEFWAMMPASEAPPSGWSVAVGLHSINKDGANDWQGITFNESGLAARDQWVKFSGVLKLGASVTRSHVWISTRGQNGSNTPGYTAYIDDFVITDITDAADAQATADANATAISSLQTKVSDIDGKVTAQTSQLSSMQSKVDGATSKVDQLSKTISDSQSTQASLNTSLQSQISAQASANIANQADLNSTMTSVATIKSTQATQATQLSAVAKSQTDMTATLNNQTASIQVLQEAVSNNDSLNSTWMVKMETNSAGQKYAAGIALGVDGKSLQSQFLVQADRFALINTSNGSTTTPFVIDNGVTYMNAAYIKDGSITNAKVGDLQSSNYSSGQSGWRIGKNGTMEINGTGSGSARTTISNGKIEVYDSNNRLRVRMGIF